MKGVDPASILQLPPPRTHIEMGEEEKERDPIDGIATKGSRLLMNSPLENRKFVAKVFDAEDIIAFIYHLFYTRCLLSTGDALFHLTLRIAFIFLNEDTEAW